MLAAKRSPLFRIALLTFAVLFAHTGRAANVQHSFPGQAALRSQGCRRAA